MNPTGELTYTDEGKKTEQERGNETHKSTLKQKKKQIRQKQSGKERGTTEGRETENYDCGGLMIFSTAGDSTFRETPRTRYKEFPSSDCLREGNTSSFDLTAEN